VGRIGVLHARYAAGARGRFATVADADSGRARKVAAELGIKAAETPEELVAAGVDGLVIATATAGHAPLVRLGVDASVPVFCEKPVALDLPTMDALVAAADSAGILVQVGFQRRFDAGYRTLRDAVANGSVGRILAMRAATHDPYPPAEEYLAASGGIFRDLHIHDFDAIRFVSGDEIVEVYATGRHSRLPGSSNTATSTWRRPFCDWRAAASSSCREPGTILWATTCASRCSARRTASCRARRAHAARRTPGPRLSRLLGPLPAGLSAELEAFVTSVRTGGKSACSLEEARSALRAALAADRSLAEHRPVALAKAPPNG
jgi:Predicted dehydrogenases and related proteins